MDAMGLPRASLSTRDNLRGSRIKQNEDFRLKTIKRRENERMSNVKK